MFGINADVAIEVFAGIIFLALVLERALSVPFEWKPILDRIGGKNLKEPIVFALSFLLVWQLEFDAIAIVFSREENGVIGYLLTALVIAGGSKGAIALFRDYFGWKSSARKAYEVNKARRTNADALHEPQK